MSDFLFVILVQVGIQKFKIAAALKYSRDAKAWIPVCVGMTAEVSAKLVALVFRRLFVSSVYIAVWALPTIIVAKRGRLKFGG